MIITPEQADVRAWLQAEHEYQFEKNERTLAADPVRSINHILGYEVPNKWHRFQLFHGAWWQGGEVRLQPQATQQLLKVVAAMRGALVWGRVLEGSTVDQASEQSWTDLSEYEQAVLANEKSCPPEYDTFAERLPIPETITRNTSELQDRFTRLSGLAVVHLVTVEMQQGFYIMPRPGVPSGTLAPWEI